MRLGNLAEATGTPVEIIRFYQREGLIPAAQRSENNYRVYTVAVIFRRQLHEMSGVTVTELRSDIQACA